jgi:pimeloyl-ACP methyl ester carboxylesterase
MEREKEKRLELEFGGIRLPAILTLPPVKTAPKWGMVIVPGSFYNDLDGNYRKEDGNPFEVRPHMYSDLARQLAEEGIAVLRYARAGKKIIDPSRAATSASFAGRVDEVAQACRILRHAVPELSRLALAGHSEGSAVALLALTVRPDIPVGAFISLSGPGQRFFDIMIEQSAPNVKNGVLDMMGTQAPFEIYKQSFRFIREGHPVPDEIRKLFPPFAIQNMPPHALGYLRDYDRLNPAEAISQIDAPALIVQGGSDTSVPPENAGRLLTAAEKNSAGASLAFFPDLNHFYKVVPPGTPPELNFALDTETDKKVGRAIADWIGGLA